MCSKLSMHTIGITKYKHGRETYAAGCISILLTKAKKKPRCPCTSRVIGYRKCINTSVANILSYRMVSRMTAVSFHQIVSL